MPCAVILSLALVAQTKPPLERLADLVATKGVTAEFTCKLAGVAKVGRGTIRLAPPNLQAFTLDWAGESYRYVHSSKGGLTVRADLKEYGESGAFSSFRPPPTTMMGLAEYVYPHFLLRKTAKDIAAGGATTDLGSETLSGKLCDKVRVGAPEGSQGGNMVFWIDKTGRLLRWQAVSERDGESVDVTLDFSKFEPGAPQTAGAYSNDLPLGYMPFNIPEPHDQVQFLGEDAVFGKWLDARKGSTVDVAKAAKGKATAVLFTDPDCAISKAMEPYLAKLRSDLKAKGCQLIEVSLGAKSPNVAAKDALRPVYWDRDGKIEEWYGIPVTPYILLADKDGLLVRGWPGYSKATEHKITETLLSAFDEG